MATTGKNKFGITLFGTISLLFLAYVLIFALYQSYREREYKKELAGVRVTIISTDGTVLMDTEKDPRTMPNHLQRHEVQQALSEGYGFDVSRTSETDGERYFYSATYFPESGQIVRSAVPYPGDRAEAPITNRGYILLSVLIFLLLSLILYLYTRRVGHHVDSTIEDYRGQVRRAEEEKIRIKHQLTQNTAHELKTPAASIQGYLETLLTTPDLPEEQRRYFLERCYSQSERMNALLKDMSTLTRLDEKAAEAAHFEAVDAAEILRSALSDIALKAQEKGIRIDVRTPDQMPLQGDESLIYSIFRNILDNALAYSAADKIRIVAKTDYGHYDFTIADNGVGVSAEHLPHLFERFYRVDKGRSRQLGGTGLGLSIVKNAVLLHGGSIEATAASPHGLMIRFSLYAEGVES